MTDKQLKQLNKRQLNWKYNEQMRTFFEQHRITREKKSNKNDNRGTERTE